MPFRAVIFDLDGTLLDTLADIGESANAALVKLGYPAHPLPDYRTFVGDGVSVLMTRVLPAHVRNPETVARAVEGFREVYGDRWNLRTQPYSGIVELLDALTARKIPLAILSNKPHDFTQQCVREFFPNHKFSAVIGQREGIPTKPDPTAALEICREWGLKPTEVLYVGDSNVDMETAARAGLHAVGVAWGFRSVEELQSHGAKEIINAPGELLSLL